MIGFASPLILLALVAVPVLWFLLRAIPPAPIKRRFPGVALMLGLVDEDRQAARTPWWLLALRMLAVTAAILGFAGPILNPQETALTRTPLLVLLDGGWAEAPDWPQRLAKAQSLVEGAGRLGRPVAVAVLADAPQAITFQAADQVQGRISGLTPRPWLPQFMPWVAALPEGEFDTAWVSDGLSHEGRPVLAVALQGRGALTVLTGTAPVVALLPATTESGKLKVAALRHPVGEGPQTLIARGPDPSGQDRDLARETLNFAGGKAEALLDLPPELRNRVTRLVIEGAGSAGAVALAGDSFKRRKIALVSDAAEGEGLQLLAPLHYLRQALAPSADLIEGAVADVVPAKPDVIVLADVATLPGAEAEALKAWVEKGGLLLRFAGPRMAAADMGDDPLMPVRLRAGGLTSGGAMSWGAPKGLADFPDSSPFRGLALPTEMTVKTQVLAEPDPDLPDRTLAALDDGTPLVTRKTLGLGQVVLFHVTANAEWSDLALTGLFVQMLERLAVSASGGAAPGSLIGLTWTPKRLMDGFGTLRDAGGLAGVPGATLARAVRGGTFAEAPPGLYESETRVVAINAVPEGFIMAEAGWPEGVTRGDLSLPQERALKGPLLALALALMAVDILATLQVSGRLARAAVLLLALALPHDARADDERAIAATQGVVLAHVLTGDATVDDTAQAGLQGLSDELMYRTAVEPLAPMGVDIETDELAFFPFLYWPVTADAPVPSAEAFAKLNRYLRTGGMILFDTRDAEYGPNSPEAEALRRIASGLDIPPLEPIPEDHVLTRTFYLLQTFPGRFSEATLWVEAAPPDAALAEGMPFRNLNDGVTPVVIGANDYASAWAVDGDGLPLLPVGRGMAGEEQREYAYRFGINLIMHVLTGNYKSDQVHVPALLERLGE
ncbi:DUF4159 domain-containing protein [Stagnihabitans tardus]|uniref:DUF4159 domain-containing protein n=1 Tax=Stagnihabitans tardus TaxID=2699202 RepID=A0AAE5BRJ7_9RHOB|nr:DUF4159 domain-containing protein [Stagnihabitans tardus]NBZ86645.1 DUF4159 domain-containing protein [Stagnihabitans tardus]